MIMSTQLSIIKYIYLYLYYIIHHGQTVSLNIVTMLPQLTTHTHTLTHSHTHTSSSPLLTPDSKSKAKLALLSDVNSYAVSLKHYKGDLLTSAYFNQVHIITTIVVVVVVLNRHVLMLCYNASYESS